MKGGATAFVAVVGRPPDGRSRNVEPLSAALAQTLLKPQLDKALSIVDLHLCLCSGVIDPMVMLMALQLSIDRVVQARSG